ncbi:hypothetical protein [Actinophytocola gossypii]|uniref:Uncharacterized protein n=1 Tax=Actinophytocola gossypii TaxID=2812003 RepID=A0ABT2JBB2_9PSEU|nr:hypothetical protein [Actinophytocola gossypii]MCT2585061.1 hypothetical protein [Actinophytocola gossypii]
MDTRDLTNALREATDDIEPPPGFTDSVVHGGRHRRTRTRRAVTAAVAGTAVLTAAVAVAVVVPTQGAGPLPPGVSKTERAPKADMRLNLSGGELVHEQAVVSQVVEAWNTGMTGAPVNPDGALDDRLGEPHVYWAGETPYGVAALVMQTVRLPGDDRVPPEQQGQERVVTGLVAPAPGTDEPRLLGVQVDAPGQLGYFLLPDDRTVLAVAPPHVPGGLSISPEIRYAGNGTSSRAWTEVPIDGGAGVLQLPEGTNVHNVRLVAGRPDEPENAKLGGHLPLLRTATYPDPAPEPAFHGLGWNGTLVAGEPRDLSRTPEDVFVTAVRDGNVLDPWSYVPRAPEWTVVAGLADGTTVVLGEWQELDHPAYLYAVTLRPGGYEVARVARVSEVDPERPLPVVYRVPGGQEVVVAARGQQLSYRTADDGTWSQPVADAALVPADTVSVRVGDEVVDL